jgi:hypothetical protein
MVRVLGTPDISFRISAAKVHKLDLSYGLVQEPGAEPLELLDGIGSEAADLIGRR